MWAIASRVTSIRLPNFRLNNATGWTGGVQAGYNMQYDPIVVGIEGAIGYSKYHRQIHRGARGATGFNGSITPRIGYVIGDFLPYVKAGIAGSNVEDEIMSATIPTSNTLIGWTAGFGVEYRVTPEISVRAEYNYTDPGRAAITTLECIFLARFRISGSDVKLGVNYHF